MADEFADYPETPEGTPLPMDALRASLTSAASLQDPDDWDDGDFEPGGRYKGFVMVPAPERVPDAHAAHPHRFYVASPRGTIGLVPWAGSKIIWPWEQGWEQDLHRSQVQSLLKEPEKEKKNGRRR